MHIAAPTRDFVTVVEDSRRWQDVNLRDDDIVISTPPKSGTTWMQGIVRSLLWPIDGGPTSVTDVSPWVDARLRPIDGILTKLNEQTHRRFIKTHTSRQSIPIGSSVSYITVYRNPADALVSWGHHRATMHPQIMGAANELAAADGLDPLPLRFEGDYDELFEEWQRYCSPARHLAEWWPHRHDNNVCLMHYADLFDDLHTHMRSLATFLELEVPEDVWDIVVERCHIDSMREQARELLMERVFEGGANTFFNRGGNGRGATILTTEQVDKVQAHCTDLLPPDALDWLEHGGPLPAS
jgi:aryl sulfotransferase